MLRSIFTGGMSFQEIVASLFSLAIVIFLCTPVHECAHAFAAKKLGDSTAEIKGRLTLNPFAHIDPLGTIAMVFCGFGWAKPVPVNLVKCRKTSMRTASVIVSLAGPVSNILMALLFMIIYKIVYVSYINSVINSGGVGDFTMLLTVIGILQQIAVINISLAVFNLLPIPPLDGYHIVEGFLPSKWTNAIERHARTIRFVFVLVLISGLFDTPLYYLRLGMYNLLNLITGFIT